MNNIVEEYKRIWGTADELAEKETLEFEKSPYKQRVRVEKVEEGKKIESLEDRDLSRTEYKDDRRTKHILGMLEMFSMEREE